MTGLAGVVVDAMRWAFSWYQKNFPGTQPPPDQQPPVGPPAGGESPKEPAT